MWLVIYHHNIIWWRLQIAKFLITGCNSIQLPVTSSLRSRFSPQYFVPKPSNLRSSLRMRGNFRKHIPETGKIIFPFCTIKLICHTHRRTTELSIIITSYRTISSVHCYCQTVRLNRRKPKRQQEWRDNPQQRASLIIIFIIIKE
jgi:hypothetical protein